MQPRFEWQRANENLGEYTDELDDGFEAIEDHEVRHLIENALKRGEHYRAARIARDVREARTERLIRKRIMSAIESTGGAIGIERLMNRVCDTEGESAMNATLCLVYIMQDEGKLSIGISETSEAIVVELQRRRRR